MADSVFLTAINLTQLRRCQQLAYAAIQDHFAQDKPERNAIIELPTGTGKTGLLAVAPFGLSRSRVLILTPNLKLAKDIAEALDIVNFPDTNVYKLFRVFDEDSIKNLEFFVVKLEGSVNQTDLIEHQVIVANYQQLQDLEKWFAGNQDLVDLIIIDEAHHQAANTYQEILDFFPSARVIGLTATPFRSDGKKIEGKPIYKYHFHEAIADGVIRNFTVVNVTPREIELQFTDEAAKRYTLDEMLNLKEEAWFNRGIALSADCCDSIARKAKEKLEDLRRTFQLDSHQIIAAAISKRHAREFVKPSFERLGLAVGMVSSDEQDRKTNDQTFQALRQGKLDVIIHIGMIGEGFDHPPLGVAAIFRPYKSLNPYIQFLGRAIRRNGDTEYSYVVSHLGLNQLKRFEEFRLFDYEDQNTLEKLFAASPQGEEVSFIPRAEKAEAAAPARAVQIRELGSEVIDLETQFVSEEKRINQLISQLEQMGPEARDKFFKRLGIDPSRVQIKVKAKSTRVRPVDKRRASRRLLNEREKSIATDILKELKLGHYNRDFNPMFRNFAWVKKRVSKTLDKTLGIAGGKRREISSQQYETVLTDNLLEQVHAENLRYFREKMKK